MKKHPTYTLCDIGNGADENKVCVDLNVNIVVFSFLSVCETPNPTRYACANSKQLLMKNECSGCLKNTARGHLVQLILQHNNSINAADDCRNK